MISKHCALEIKQRRPGLMVLPTVQITASASLAGVRAGGRAWCGIREMHMEVLAEGGCIWLVTVHARARGHAHGAGILAVDDGGHCSFAGLMDAALVESTKIEPYAMLPRGVAGIRGRHSDHQEHAYVDIIVDCR